MSRAFNNVCRAENSPNGRSRFEPLNRRQEALIALVKQMEPTHVGCYVAQGSCVSSSNLPGVHGQPAGKAWGRRPNQTKSNLHFSFLRALAATKRISNSNLITQLFKYYERYTIP